MTARSLKVQPEYKEKVRNSLSSLGLTQKIIYQRLVCTRQPVSKFFNCKPVSYGIFTDICRILDLDWREITGINDNSLVNQLQEQVQADIETRCGTMRILDMSQPIGLNDVFTRVNILEKISGRRRKNINELIDDCNLQDFDHFNLGEVQEKISGKEAVNKYRTLLILGKPGAGKTTFLKHLVIQCSRGFFQSELVPFFITLKEFAEAEEQLNLLDYLAKYIRDENQEYLDKILKHGKALICLDGLDEVLEQDSERVIREINKLAITYPQNQYLMTCRIAAKEYTFTQFTEVEIADFDWEQITIFANNWFKNKLIKPKKFIERLEKDRPIKELASSPLLLTLLCLTFEESGEFPRNRAMLYKEGIDALLKKWDASRGIERDKVYRELWVRRKEDLFSEIAWNTFSQGEYFFQQDRIEREIEAYIRNLPSANRDKTELKLDSEVILRSIESQHGLLVERARHIYAFSHRTFQEYFTARERVSIQPSLDEALEELVSHIFDKRWHEVFLLTSSMLPDAEKLLLLMKNQIDDLCKNSSILNSFLTSLHDKSNNLAIELSLDLENKYLLQTIIRSFYFEIEANLPREFFTLFDRKSTDVFVNIFILSGQRDLDRLIANFLSFTNKLSRRSMKYFQMYNRPIIQWEFLNFIKDVEETFQKIIFHPDTHDDLRIEMIELAEETPGRRRLWYYELHSFVEKYIWDFQPSWWIENGQLWVEKFRKVFVKYRFIGKDWQFDHYQRELLEQYYYANQLLIQCLHQDCYVRSEVRQQIEETLFLPYDDAVD